MIIVKDAVKRYNQKTVLDNVSVRIEKGKITSFIGPNGAGKSTLLSLISRTLKKDGGQIYIEGKEISQWPDRELAKKVAILKQTNQISIKLTIRELVSFGRFPYSGGKLTQEDWDHVDRAIAYLKLTDIQHKFIDQLSGGQLQRAFIAMVIAQDTEYILLDEPLNNLDMKHSVEIMRTLRQLVDELGKTVVIVIHDINFASCYSDYIVALKDGKIAEEGGVGEVIEEERLGAIYDMNFNICNIEDQKITVYYM